jgi:NAD+ synthase
MTERRVIALAQLNPVMGDLAHNVGDILAARAQAQEDAQREYGHDCDLLVTPELSLSGYPPEDLVRRPDFLAACRQALGELISASHSPGPALVVGLPWREADKVHNAIFLVAKGRVAARRFKHVLPNYGVFDEKRVFDSGSIATPVDFRGMRLGLMVCEDLWMPEVAAALARAGAELLIVPNGSPYDLDKARQRGEIARARHAETGLPILYVNQVGGQDELVFDGASFVLDGDSPAARMAHFTRQVFPTCWERGEKGWACLSRLDQPARAPERDLWDAMTLGLRDYVEKNKFPAVVLGLSGGIDSALTAAVAVDALGLDKVRTVMMPSPYTSAESIADAAACARLLGTVHDTIPIAPLMGAADAALAASFTGRAPDTTEENIQARLRGMILMALSNKFGALVLTTGNKSELAVGYATLYGDMCGGYSVLKDLYKTQVFALARWRNRLSPVMPVSVIEKPPSAELRPNQKDEDTLPPYALLDEILALLIEGEKGIEEVASLGYDSAMVKKIAEMMRRAEYKRRQAPPGVKLSVRAFGRDWRYPLTNRFGVPS